MDDGPAALHVPLAESAARCGLGLEEGPSWSIGRASWWPAAVGTLDEGEGLTAPAIYLVTRRGIHVSARLTGSDGVADLQGGAEAEERVMLHEMQGCVSVGCVEDGPA